ncbi:substrate-binding periplasmic protein [Mangrovicella endophytica]|uniref:substrate-binding periplasmic protein n=1 Tax=Mangrovicella endophytica TaxID=2066697 RepID=UPI000C9DE35D|nr:transporter substrate-binding domain-containing protein [Mangrovicella endophytica]
MKQWSQGVAGLAVVIGLGVGTAAAQDCTPKHQFETVESGKLTVALTNTAPYSLEKDGAIAGIDGELVQQFAKENCLETTYEIFTYPGAVSAVQTRRADIALGGFYRTAAREKVVALSTPVYLDQLSVASAEGLDTVDAIMGKKVGTVEGYLWVSDMEKLFEGSQTYPSSLNLAQDLQAKRIDVALDGFGSAVVQNEGKDFKVKVLKQDPRISATLNPSQTSFLLDKSNTAFVDAVNASIETYRKDGAIAEALKKYGLDPSAAEVGESRVIQ